MESKVSIMQPYLFPYLGYFQLIKASDAFVFYDDVNFIKRGWINRNRILMNNREKLVSVPLVKASQNKLIKDVQINYGKEYDNVLKTIETAYRKAPNFEVIMNLVDQVFSEKYSSIGEMASASIIKVLDYLQIKKDVYFSSNTFSEYRFYDKANRLINITKSLNASIYINPLGGSDLYDKSFFKEQGVKLYFMENHLEEYEQFNNEFIKGLSVIDVLMFNSIEKVIELLDQYNLV